MSDPAGTLILQSIFANIAAWLASNQAAILGKVQQILPGVEDLLEDLDFDIGQFTGDVLGGVDDLLGDFESGISSRIGDNISQSFDAFNGFVGTIGSGVSGILENAGGVITSAGQSVTGSLNSLIRSIEDTLDDMVRRMFNAITDALESALGVISSAVGAVFDSLSAAVSNAIDTISDLASSVINSVSEIVGDIADAIQGAFERIEETIGALIDGATETLANVGQAIGDLIDSGVAQAQQVADSIIEGFEGAIEEITKGVGSIIDGVVGSLNDLQQAVISGLQGIGDIAAENVRKPFEVLIDKVSGGTAGIFSAVVDGIDAEFEEMIRALFESVGFPRDAADTYIRILERTFPANPIMQFLVILLLVFQLAQGVAEVPVAMASQRFAQDIAEDYQFALPSPADVQQETLRGMVADGDAITTLKRAGFSEEEARRQLELRRMIPDIGIVQTWYLREFITRDDAKAKLGELGLSEDDAELILRMSFFIPPVQDLITMAVREVFNPEIAARFGQFDDFPERFAEEASKQGVSQEWAQNYWAAHWALPSVQMAFEMLHRRVIDEDDLRLLMQAQDIMPGWRENLIKISFSPLTRVDVRRMHDLGVLSDADLIDKYMDLGYDRTNAELLQHFTIAYNAPPETETPEELESLTRAAVIGLFGDGAINEATALALLKTLGIGTAAAEIFIEAEKIQGERRDRKDQTGLVIDQASAGLLSFTEAYDALGSLGLEQLELKRALTNLERKRAAATTLPSKADLGRMLGAEIISTQEYVAGLKLLGYSDTWAERYLRLEKA